MKLQAKDFEVMAPVGSRESLADAEALVRESSRSYRRLQVGALVVFVAER